MKKFLALFLAFALVLTACSQKETSQNKKLVVYTSMFVMTDFVKQIGGNQVDVHQLLPEGAEVHDWEPSAKDMAKLEKADLFVYNGAHLEHWAEELNLNCPKVDASQHVSVNGEDPHVWLDPARAIEQVKTITKALKKADPAHAASFDKRAKSFTSSLHSLVSRFKILDAKTIVVTHAAFGYWSAYGLDQVGLTNVGDEEEPSPTRVKEVVDLMKEKSITILYREPETSQKLAKAVAEEAGAKVKTLFTLESRTKAQIKANDDYVSLMEANLKTLQEE